MIATAPHANEDRRLFRLLWLSIAAAVATIALKTTAWLLTGSVGLLSDAAESVVNLVAAIAALALLFYASKPADERLSRASLALAAITATTNICTSVSTRCAPSSVSPSRSSSSAGSA